MFYADSSLLIGQVITDILTLTSTDADANVDQI